MIDLEREAKWLLDDKYGGKESLKYYADLGRLKSGVPLAYLIGWVPFLNAKIFLDSRPLIPRPETEYWVSRSLEDIKGRSGQVKVLDLCAGSGCIGIAVLKAIPETDVDFAEIDATHHKTIEKNIRENGIDPSRARVFGGDLFENTGEKYDFILSNPPYIDPLLDSRVDENVIGYEPARALWGGKGGMEFIERIVCELTERLAPGGAAYIEHEPEQAERMLKLAPSAELLNDQFGLIRVTRITIA